MNSKRYVLNIQKPWISCYTSYSHLLSILQCDDRTHEWIYSHFIQMYLNKDLSVNSWGEFYKPMTYEVNFFEICKWLKFQKIRRNLIVDNKQKILDFVVNELKEGYYVHLQIEHKYIKSFQNNNHYHDALIYGIDLEKNIVYAQDVFFNGILETKELTVDEFLDSVYYCDVPEECDYLKESIYCYTINDKCDYEFAVENIWNSLNEYINSKVPEYWRLYNNANRKHICFGLEIYDALINYIKYTEISNIDIRPFYVLKDHFIILKKTLKYLMSNFYRSDIGYSDYINIYDNLLQLTEQLHMLILVSKQIPKKTKTEKIIKILNEMKTIEIKIKDTL